MQPVRHDQFGASGNGGGDPAPRSPLGPAQSQPQGPAADPAHRLNMLLSDASYRTDSWAEIVPRLLGPMGIRAHLAGSGQQATHLIQSMPIHVALVDLGLPLESGDPTQAPEGGYRLLDILSRLANRPPMVAIISARTPREEGRQLSAALHHGVFAVMNRPRTAGDVETLLEVLRRCVTRHYKGRWPTS